MQMIRIPDLSLDDRQRFLSKVEKVTNGCWLWCGAKDSSGYGLISLRDRKFKAHRVAIKVAGYAMPTGSVIDHICRNRACVNPEHLRTVDCFTNVHENSEALAHLNSLKTHCGKGHPYSGDNLIIHASGKRRCRECDKAYHRKRRLDAKAR